MSLYIAFIAYHVHLNRSACYGKAKCTFHTYKLVLCLSTWNQTCFVMGLQPAQRYEQSMVKMGDHKRRARFLFYPKSNSIFVTRCVTNLHNFLGRRYAQI